MEVMSERSNTRSNKPPGDSLRVVSAHSFASNWTLALYLLNQQKRKNSRKVLPDAGVDTKHVIDPATASGKLAHTCICLNNFIRTRLGKRIEIAS